VKKRAFVAFPFRGEYAPVVSLIKAAAHQLDLEIVDPSEENYAGSITSFIRNSIASSDAVIAVVTEENGNVYYEVGLAHCQRKAVVLLTADASTLKFDLKDQRAIVYDPKDTQKSIAELVGVLNSAMQPQNADDFIMSAFHGTAEPPYKKILRLIEGYYRLREPQIIGVSLSTDRSNLLVEVKDFFGRSVKAAFDINGQLLESRQIDA
jgi:hypothetical protein